MLLPLKILLSLHPPEYSFMFYDTKNAKLFQNKRKACRIIMRQALIFSFTTENYLVIVSFNHSITPLTFE
jgi:hypothetical protein